MFWFTVGVVAVAAFTLIMSRSSGQKTWHTSENGNQTRIYQGTRITVFSSDGGWKYCISAPVGDDDPYYSSPYVTQEEAMDCGMAFVDGRPDPHKTRREKREDNKLTMALEETSAADDTLRQLTDKITEMHLSGKFLVKDITPIKRIADKQERALIEVYKLHYSEDRGKEASHTWELRDGFKDISEHCDALLSWLRSASKDNRGEAPPFKRAY